MSSKEPSTATTDPAATVPLSTVFCADDADVIIRAAGALDFRAHKSILSLVSPIFKDMFTVPQPPSDTPGTLPHVDVQESAKTWENILRTIYPMPHPIIDDLDDLESLFLAARVYEMQPIIEIHKKAFENRAFIVGDPLRLYVIACACGLEDQAKYVARNAELLKVTKRPDTNDSKDLTFGSYRRLVSFLAERDNEWLRILDENPPQMHPYCGCERESREESGSSLYKNIKKDLQQPYLQAEEIYLKALECRSRQKGCSSGGCSLADSQIKYFIDGMIRRRDQAFDKFQPPHCSHEERREGMSA